MTTLEEKMAMRKLAIEGKPFGPGSHTPHEGKTMTGAQAIIASLEAEGVDTIFGYPGGQAIKIYDALYDSKQINHVLARHEQGATHMADGYARATGKVGVVLVTSGPGATNTVTGIATAYMDSIPMVVITGQVTRGVIGTDSFQESDIVGITMPVVKHSFLLQSTDDLTRTFREAFYIASTGRPGPVLIDIPSDLSGAEMIFHYPDSVNLPSYKPTYRGNARQVKQAAELIEKAERPLGLDLVELAGQAQQRMAQARCLQDAQHQITGAHLAFAEHQAAIHPAALYGLFHMGGQVGDRCGAARQAVQGFGEVAGQARRLHVELTDDAVQVGVLQLQQLVKPVGQFHIRIAPQLAEHGGGFDGFVGHAVEFAEQCGATDFTHALDSLRWWRGRRNAGPGLGRWRHAQVGRARC